MEDEQQEFELFEGDLTEEDIVGFAKMLGMHPIRDKELLWFAEESNSRLLTRISRLW